jgi:hypothetical protein
MMAYLLLGIGIPLPPAAAPTGSALASLSTTGAPPADPEPPEGTGIPLPPAASPTGSAPAGATTFSERGTPSGRGGAAPESEEPPVHPATHKGSASATPAAYLRILI